MYFGTDFACHFALSDASTFPRMLPDISLMLPFSPVGSLVQPLCVKLARSLFCLTVAHDWTVRG